jgi:hypothetical protein
VCGGGAPGSGVEVQLVIVVVVIGVGVSGGVVVMRANSHSPPLNPTGLREAFKDLLITTHSFDMI